MTLSQAQQLAESLMTHYGLKDWRFQFDSAKRRFGACNYTRKQIRLSALLTQNNDEVRVKDTILHEIAHALTPGHGHDKVWKAKCREIGCSDERCFTSEDTNIIAGKYKAVCGGCGKVFTRHRKTRTGRRHACLCQNHLPWDKKKLLEFSHC